MPRQHDRHDEFDAFIRRRIQASDAFVTATRTAWAATSPVAAADPVQVL
ncbi:hypothetical protein [Massilia luteola]|nr:hypothetical protein [Massilia sp. Gc5]